MRILGIVSGGLTVLLITAYLVVTSGWFFKTVILAKASAALDATVTVEDASVSPFSAVGLTRLQIQTTGAEPLLRAEAVRLRYSLWAILRGHIRVAEATIDSPVIQLIENADGSSNLDPILKSLGTESKPGAAAAESTGPLRLDLQQVALKNVKLRHIKVLPNGIRQTAEISRLDLTAANIANARSGRFSLTADLKLDQASRARRTGCSMPDFPVSSTLPSTPT